MSLTFPFAHIPRRSAPMPTAAPQPARRVTVSAARISSVIHRVVRGAVSLAAMMLVLLAITAFNAWMWWPHH